MSDNEQLYFGGEVYTVDESCPAADAVAVRDGKIIAVGSESACRAALGEGYESIDLDGGVLLPGFIDTHFHPVGMIVFEMYADLSEVTSIKELQDELRDSAKQDPTAKWIMGLQLDDKALDESRSPNRHDLDAACPDRPAIVVTHDGHTVIANTKAIETTGVSASTEDPEGGAIDREPDGYPAGPFRETAVEFPLGALPMPEIQKITSTAKVVFEKIVARGITSGGIVIQTDEEGTFGSQGAYDVLLMTILLDMIPINMYLILVAHNIEPFESARGTKLHDPEVGAGHRINGFKFWADGTFGSCTAYMREPFTDQPDKTGFMVHSEDEMYRRMVEAHNAGLQIAIHVIGDAAIRAIIDLYDRLLSEHPKEDHRHRLEHASLLDAKMIEDIARLGLVVSTQPMFIHSEKNWLHKRIGAKRAKWTYPFRTLLDGGVKVAGASDAPVESIDVLHAIECCVTREGFETQEGITAEEAIRMFTIDAAYAQFEESVKGSISVGKRADLVVLSENPAKAPPEKIRDIRVVRTIVSGKTVYLHK